MNKKIFCGLFLMLMMAACSKNGTNTVDAPLYVGTWKWLYTGGGIADHIRETPSTTGKRIDLKLTQHNQYFIYTNGALTSEGTYTVETKKCIHNNTNKTFLNFSSAADRDLMIEELDCEIMDLSDEAHDGLTSRYAKMRGGKN
jgi:hypothetical protein